jgi:hypothetical protein
MEKLHKFFPDFVKIFRDPKNSFLINANQYKSNQEKTNLCRKITSFLNGKLLE